MRTCVGAQISHAVGVLPEKVMRAVQLRTSIVACARYGSVYVAAIVGVAEVAR